MERRQLEYFLAVVECGGFTSAAADLHVSQPSLSRGIHLLERELGATLFTRLSRGVTLTAAGEALVGPARQVMRDLATARSSVQKVAGLMAGRLEIVSLTALAVHPLAVLIGAFRQRYPLVDIKVTDPPSPGAIPEMVRVGQRELGLTDSLDELAGLRRLHLGSQVIRLVLPPNSVVTTTPVPLVEVARLPFIAAPQGSSTRELVDQSLSVYGIPPRLAVEITHWAAIVPLVLAGAGAALLPEPLALDAERQGALVVPTIPVLTRPVGLVWRDGAVSPAARALLDLAISTGIATSESSPLDRPDRTAALITTRIPTRIPTQMPTQMPTGALDGAAGGRNPRDS